MLETNMSSMSDTGPTPGAGGTSGYGTSWRRSGSCGIKGWSPVEILATVLGFMVYWPIGVGLIAWKLMRQNGSTRHDWFGNLRSSFAGHGFGDAGAAFRADWSGFAPGRTGNAAFDEWRKSEIERLEAERRKLEEAQREFAAFAEEARRARDREEFERFMSRHRPGGQG
jgi:hypothetical protein